MGGSVQWWDSYVDPSSGGTHGWVQPTEYECSGQHSFWELTDAEIRTRAVTGPLLQRPPPVSYVQLQGRSQDTRSFQPFAVSLFHPSRDPCIDQSLFHKECKIQFFNLRTLPQTTSAMGIVGSSTDNV
jgi:hypothetical protein